MQHTDVSWLPNFPSDSARGVIVAEVTSYFMSASSAFFDVSVSTIRQHQLPGRIDDVIVWKTIDGVSLGGFPGGIEADWIFDPFLLHHLRHVLSTPGMTNPDDDHLVLELLGEFVGVRNTGDTWATPGRPEIEDYDLAFQRRRCGRRTVDPIRDVEGWGFTRFHGLEPLAFGGVTFGEAREIRAGHGG